MTWDQELSLMSDWQQLGEELPSSVVWGMVHFVGPALFLCNKPLLLEGHSILIMPFISPAASLWPL